MEDLQGVQIEGRYHSKGNYDRRFIIKIIREIDGGLSTRAACAKYTLSLGSVNRWLAEPQFRQVKPKRKVLSMQQKRSVVRAVVDGRLSYKEAAVAFQVSVKAIQNWEKSFARENAELCEYNHEDLKKKETTSQTPAQNEEVRQLKEQLEDAQLKIAALNTLIDVAEEQLKIDIRKKPGARQS